MTFEIITTERLQLRKLTPEVYEYIYRHFTDTGLMDFLGLDADEKLATEKEKFNKNLRTHNRSFVNFQIIQGGKIIGGCGFHTWYVDHARAEIGYALFDDAYKGKGLMTEALTAVLQYGFEEMKLHRIEAFIGPNNLPSLKLVRNAGFTKEGNLREHYLKDGEWQDSGAFSLLKHEYQAD